MVFNQYGEQTVNPALDTPVYTTGWQVQSNTGDLETSGSGTGAPGGVTPGFVTAPAVPSSTVAAPNTNGLTAVVTFLTTGTATVVVVKDAAGTTKTYTTSIAVGNSYSVPPGGSIAITYSVAPTWTWELVT